MGLLDQVIGGVLGQVLGGGRDHGREGTPSGGGLGGAMSPLVQALLMLLLSKGAGGLGDILGGGRPHPQDRPAPRDDGDIGGFGQDRDRGRGDDRGRPSDTDAGGGDFGDLAGMLDGPGDRQGGADQGAGPYAHLDREAGDGHGGLDGLIDRFQRGGFGDVIESWIGHGQNRPLQPNQLADALGTDTVDALEQRTGLDRTELLSQLAQVLPEVVDRLTPQGRRPDGHESRGW